MRIEITTLYRNLFRVCDQVTQGFKDESLSAGRLASVFESLSDQLFVAACVEQIRSVIGASISVENAKRRIVVPLVCDSDGSRGFNTWFDSPLFFACDRNPFGVKVYCDTGSAVVSREIYLDANDKVWLYCGQVPPKEYSIDREPFDPNLESTYLLDSNPASAGRLIKAYEMKGNYVIRELTIARPSNEYVMPKSIPEPVWIGTDNKTQISKNLFLHFEQFEPHNGP